MKKYIVLAVALLAVALWLSSDLWARGGRGGGGGGFGGGGGVRGGGGGGYAGGGAGRTPSMSRPSSRSSISLPSGGGTLTAGRRPGDGASRPAYGNLPTPGGRPGAGAGNRPGGIAGLPGGGRPAAGARPGAGTLPGVASRPGASGRPSAADLQHFLDLPGAGGGYPRSSSLPGGALAGGAAAEFLHEHPDGFRPAAGTRPAPGDLAGNLPTRPGANGLRPGGDDSLRPGRPGDIGRPADNLRPGRPGDGQWANHRPGRIDNLNQWNGWRKNHRDDIWGHWHDHWGDHDHWFNHDWWNDHPNLHWHYHDGFNCWGWATWPLVTGWFPWGWTEPVYYSYGDNVYYQDDQVYYGTQPVATADEYAQQAEAIATSVPDDQPADTDWMPLGVFAVTPDGQPTGAEPTMYLQLAVSKQGIISGTYQNTATGSVESIEGMVDKQSQRAAWTVVGKTRPLMEAGIVNLTQDTSPVLVHFADGTTQQLLLVRLDQPKANGAAPAPN